ncbi:RagB/SusD family nutrient uptake outer membrane protein [Sphingobacterium sp. DK4209]|uniref:RagB/SusD family nutrient uptake outer membrane protein n=2 Tax=Sphingobacterium zhuxiongii TaxID=2662364 RepID=A0A5Q0Q662_9SPHI|nr:RagB/SusD family nutrient uptake outer membrane protein [Sphingobacterium sp. DK4209]QGA24953.1 RagB/SusD family nutrient uptake outer membrane protein [Sphingobacterium sp. dk4302]
MKTMKYLIALVMLAMLATSCNKKLDITPPDNIIDEQVRELLRTADEETVKSLMKGMADGLPPHYRGSGYNFRFSSMSDNSWSGQLAARMMLGNDIVVGNWSMPAENDYYTGQDLTSENSASTPSWWHRAYGMTNAANKVLNIITPEVLQNNPSVSLKEYVGRAYLTRAFGYLYAQQNFGTNKLGQSIYVKFDVTQPLQERSSALATLDSIIVWATSADEMFAAANVGFKATNTSDLTRGLTNYVIAKAALLAVEAEGATASKYYTIAQNACDRVINSGTLNFMSEDQYVQKQSGTVTLNGVNLPIFLAETSGFLNLAKNPEAAFGFGWQFGGNGVAAESNPWGGSFRIDDRLFNKIDDKDYRKKNFHKERPADFPVIYSAGSGSFMNGPQYEVPTYWVSKFANNVGLGSAVGAQNTSNRGRADYAMVRLSEFYLMKAEVQARTGAEAAAKTTLNKLLAARTAAGSATLTCDNYAGMSGLTALQMVQLQSRIELWGEGSHEWDNNRRWNIPVDRKGSTVHWNPNLVYPVSLMTMKIPSEEISTNPKSQQNP